MLLISIFKKMNDVNSQNQYRDQNVMSFMMQLVQEKFGDDVELNFMNQESERLYNLFGNNLVSFFEPMLTDEQKTQFSALYSQNSDQEALLAFLIQSIPDLEMKMLQILVDFKNAYLTNRIK
jgi:hypothetical protein